MKNNMVKRIIEYLGGMLLISVGISFAKMSELGISPGSSLSRALEACTDYSLGTMVILVYCLVVLVQLLLLRKDFKIKNALGIPIAIVFGWMVDFVGINPNTFGHLMYNFPRPEGYLMRLLYLLISTVIIGLGVALYLKPNLIPMPVEGLAATISEKTGKPFGDCKTFVDLTLITLALIIQLLFLGGLKSFTGPNLVVREGTIFSGIFVGQVVKFINKKMFNK